MATTSTRITVERAWLDQNPLRLWRKREGVSIMAAARRIGCSTAAIQKWEAGAARPTDESVLNMATVIGVKDRSLRSAWNRWEREAPDAGTAA